MPRNIVVNEKPTNEEKEMSLDELIDQYYEANKIKLEKDKIVKANGPKIKEQLTTKGLQEYSTKNYIAKLSTATSIEYDDAKLLQIIKTLPSNISNNLIETVEVVNLEKLERLLITGEIKASQLRDAEVEKKTVKLTIKEEKK